MLLAPNSAPHASFNEASAVSSRANVKNIFLTDDVSRTTWWVNTQVKSRTKWWVNTQEQCEGSTLWCGRNWSFEASIKIEDSEYLLQHSTNDKNFRTDVLWLFVSFPRLTFAVSWPPMFLLIFWLPVVLNRIRGFRDSDSENLCQQQSVFLPSYDFSIQCGRVKLANRTRHTSCNSLLSRS